MRKERYIPSGHLALSPQAWGLEFMIVAPIAETQIENGCAIVSIEGPLVQHSHPFWDSYDAIKTRVAQALAVPEAESVLLKINSPGGDMLGCIEAAREIKAMAFAAKKPLYAHTDGMAASAAYALACAAERICVTPTAFAGSVGVIEALVDQSAADAASGVRFLFAASGERKTDGNPHVPITAGAAQRLQTQVDSLAELFFDWVGECRGAKGLSAKAVRGLQAGMYFGWQAVSAKLADDVKSLSEVLTRTPPKTTLQTKTETGPKGKAMPKYLEENRDKLAESIGQAIKDGDSEGEKKMRKALKALEDDSSSAEKEEGGDKEAASAKAEEEDKKAKAEEEEKKAKAAEEEKKAKALAASGDASAIALSALAEVQSLKAQIAERATAEAEDKARAAIFAKRPDLPAAAVAILSAVPLAKVQGIVDAFPKGPVNPHAAALAATGSRGESQTETEASLLDPKEAAHIDAAMGLGHPTAGIKHKGNTAEFGFMTPAQAVAHLQKLQANAGKVS